MSRSEVNHRARSPWARYLLLALAMTLGAAATGATNTLQWSWANPLPGPDYFNQIAFNGSTYVIAGNDGTLYTSGDGVSWTPEASVIGRGGRSASLIYGGGHFILAGGDGKGINHLFSSTDGNRWTAITIKGWTSDGTHIRLYYASNTYFLVDLYTNPLGTYFSSTDAVHWTTRAEGFSIDQMMAANGVLLAWGNKTDGKTNGSDVLEYSKDDGTTWNEVTTFTPVIPAFYTDGHTLFLTDSDERANGIYSSSDGAHWTKRTSTYIGPSFADPVLWNGSKFLTVAYDAGIAYLYSSTDGVTWSKGPVSNLQEYTPSVVLSGSEYTAVGPGQLQVVRSSDFAFWTSVFSGITGPDINFSDVVHGKGQYVAVGYVTTPGALGTPQPAGIAESSDGLHWSGVYNGTAVYLSSVAYGNGRYVAASGAGSWLSSSDGVNWSAAAKPPATASSQVVFGNGVFAAFVGCETRCYVAASPDGQAWTTRALPSEMTPLDASSNPALGRLGNRFVTVVPGSDASVVYTSDDGLNWEAGSSVPALAEYDFTHMREVAGSLVAIGTNNQSCANTTSECASTQAVAVTHDAVHWSIADSTAISLQDVTGDAQGYYATNIVGPAMMESQDGLHWCDMTRIPTLFGGMALAMNGTQIVVTGSAGAIIATPQPSSGVSNPPITCETEAEYQASLPPPTKTGSSGGRGDTGESVLILLALSLMLRNRRGGEARHPPSRPTHQELLRSV